MSNEPAASNIGGAVDVAADRNCQAPVLRTRNVYVDTSIFVESKFGFARTAFARLLELTGVGQTTLYTTSILDGEVYANIADAATQGASAAKKFRRDAAILSESDIPVFAGLFSRVDKSAIETHLRDRYATYMREANAVTIPIGAVSVDLLFENYFAGHPPFENRESKKYEFPDAVVVAALDLWCRERSELIYVVTGDEGFASAAGRTKTLIPLRHIDEYLDLITAGESPFVSVVRSWLRDHSDEVKRAVADEFASLGVYVEEAEGDAEDLVVDTVEFHRALLIDVEDDYATFTIQGRIEFSVDVTYEDPDSGVWDSEDKVMLFQDSLTARFHVEHDADIELLLSFDPDELKGIEGPVPFDAFELEIGIDRGREVWISIYDEHEVLQRRSWHDDPPEFWNEELWTNNDSQSEKGDEQAVEF